MGYQKIKGTQDFYGEIAAKRRYVEEVARSVVRKYNIDEIITPVFENTEVFTRSSGDGSDIVNKEMYTFLDKGKRSITLRPEGTAGVTRSFLENKLYVAPGLKKYFYVGPMFRYEQPQAGRYREFNQFGVEMFGDSGSYLDAEVIMLAHAIFKKLGIDKYYTVKVNTIGDFATRNNYTNVLKDYFTDKIDNLCEDCKRRLEKNPMRILDCKVDKENEILINAPKINDYLSEQSKEYFKNIIDILDLMDINYEIDSNLVRGLDYYTDTVFEFVINSNDELNGLTICAGGKYSDLTTKFNGPSIPGIGFAFGVERIMSVVEKYGLYPNLKDEVDLALFSLDSESKKYNLKLASKLREEGLNIEMDYVNNTLKHQFKLSDRCKARFIGIVGETERENGTITIKDTVNAKQEVISVNEISKYIKENK